MILKLLLEIIFKIFKIVFQFLGTLPIFQNTNIHTRLITIIEQILSITQQAVNFMYLIFGDTLYIIMPILIALITTKYFVVPLVQIFRSFFIKGNE